MVKVEVPESLYRRLEVLARKSNYKNVNEFIITILRDAARRMEEEILHSDVSEEEKKEIIERLRSLGYL